MSHPEQVPMLNETTIGHPGDASGKAFSTSGRNRESDRGLRLDMLNFLGGGDFCGSRHFGAARRAGGTPEAGASGVTLTFPDFPAGVVVIDLGQTLDVDVTAANDAGKGVTWTSAGDACAKPAKMTSTHTKATFTALGITGTATITAKSLAQPAITRGVTVTVGLNDVPDALCTGDCRPRVSNDSRTGRSAVPGLSQIRRQLKSVSTS